MCRAYCCLDKDQFYTSLNESPTTQYVMIYKTIYVYYLNKLYDLLKKSCD